MFTPSLQNVLIPAYATDRLQCLLNLLSRPKLTRFGLVHYYQ